MRVRRVIQNMIINMLKERGEEAVVGGNNSLINTGAIDSPCGITLNQTFSIWLGMQFRQRYGHIAHKKTKLNYEYNFQRIGPKADSFQQSRCLSMCPNFHVIFLARTSHGPRVEPLRGLKSPFGGGDSRGDDGGMGGGGIVFGKKKSYQFFFLTPAETKNIGATIRIGREILCLPYAGFSWQDPETRGLQELILIFLCPLLIY